MNFDRSNYFLYKKNKIQSTVQEQRAPISKLNFLFQLFVATFVIMFIVIVVSIMKYSSKVDIEYNQTDIPFDNIKNPQPLIVEDTTDDVQRKIDKRLLLIQQEENAPSEARIIAPKNESHQVIDPKHIIKEESKNKKIKITQVDASQKHISIANDIRLLNKNEENITILDKNITILSKVLIGKFASFDEAQKMQSEIKLQEPKLTPFVRKVGEVYSVQMGSYQDFEIAKKQAHQLRLKGFDVWIYQQ